MAYKALYRTYRPTTFSEVAGQEHIVRTLQNAITKNKIAHAYLFCGPRGTGKTSIAKIFAKGVNCTSDTQRPCMECDSCLAITEGTHPDIVEIDAASNNGVEEVRSLIEKVKYAPIEGQYKIYIIDEVHMMSVGAFNALLKTIEEPPKHVIFILATTEPQKVLPTIISRCQRYDFTKVSKIDIIKRIEIILDKENIHCDEEVIRMIAQLSDGGMRDALSILDQCIAYAQNNIQIKHINDIYGILTVVEKVELFTYIIEKKASQLIERINGIIERGVDIKRLTMDLIDILKDTVIFDYTKDTSLLQLLEEKEVQVLVKNSTTKQRLDMIYVLMDTYDKYRNAANVGSYFEVCLLKLMSIDKKIVEVQANTLQSSAHNMSIPKEVTNKSVQVVSRETSSGVESAGYGEEDYSIFEERSDIKVQPDNTAVHDIPPSVDNKTAHPLDDEFVLQLLVGANKPEKIQDLKNFKNIYEYTMELKWAKGANLLKNSKIMASAVSYLVLTVGSQAEANEINEKDSLGDFQLFTQELLKKTKKVFAVTNEQQIRVTNNFRERMSEGTLPKIIEFDVKTNVEEIKKTEEIESEEDILVNLFGKDNIVITED